MDFLSANSGFSVQNERIYHLSLSIFQLGVRTKTYTIPIQHTHNLPFTQTFWAIFSLKDSILATLLSSIHHFLLTFKNAYKPVFWGVTGNRQKVEKPKQSKTICFLLRAEISQKQTFWVFTIQNFTYFWKLLYIK